VVSESKKIPARMYKVYGRSTKNISMLPAHRARGLYLSACRERKHLLLAQYHQVQWQNPGHPEEAKITCLDRSISE
jgi:hypothetical protein